MERNILGLRGNDKIGNVKIKEKTEARDIRYTIKKNFNMRAHSTNGRRLVGQKSNGLDTLWKQKEKG